MSAPEPRDPAPPRPRRRVANQVLACGWCGEPVTVAAVGRTPKWCGGSCRHRAWEARRAAAHGLVAVQVVDRTIEVEVPVIVAQPVAVPTKPRDAGWAPALRDLAQQLDAGRVYDRDLPELVDALNVVLAALGRRPAVARRPR